MVAIFLSFLHINALNISSSNFTILNNKLILDDFEFENLNLIIKNNTFLFVETCTYAPRINETFICIKNKNISIRYFNLTETIVNNTNITYNNNLSNDNISNNIQINVSNNSNLTNISINKTNILMNEYYDFNNKIVYEINISNNTIDKNGIYINLSIINYFDINKNIDLIYYFYRHSQKYSKVYDKSFIVNSRNITKISFNLFPESIKNDNFNLKIKLKKSELKTFKEFKYDIFFINNSIKENDIDELVNVYIQNDSNENKIQINDINEIKIINNSNNYSELSSFFEEYGENIEFMDGNKIKLKNNDILLNEFNQVMPLLMQKFEIDDKLNSKINLMDLVESKKNIQSFISYKVIIVGSFLILLLNFFGLFKKKFFDF